MARPGASGGLLDPNWGHHEPACLAHGARFWWRCESTNLSYRTHSDVGRPHHGSGGKRGRGEQGPGFPLGLTREESPTHKTRGAMKWQTCAPTQRATVV